MAAVAALLLLAGCGSTEPQLQKQDAASLIALANAIATETPCAQARDIRLLRARTIVLVSEQRVPTALRRQLVAGVDALNAPTCLPAAPVATVAAAPHPGAKRPKPHHEKSHGHGKHK